MQNKKIIVKTQSSNLWWGIYGFCEKAGWEDLSLNFENEETIVRVCLNSKSYLRAGIEDLRNDNEDRDFVEAIENFLEDNKCHYWYYYNDREDKDFYEVPYDAPLNSIGVKPCFMDIWHPDEGIGISTIRSAVKSFAKQYLKLDNCEIEIDGIVPIDESLKSFKENEELFGGNSKVEIKFTDELIEDLSQYFKKTKEEILIRLNNSIK